MRNYLLPVLFICVAAFGVKADVILTNHESPFDLLNIPGFVTGNAPDAAGATGHLDSDSDIAFKQTFTIDSEIILDSIYIGYSGYEAPPSYITLYLEVGAMGHDTHCFTGLFPTGHVHNGSNDGPFSYIQFDLSTEQIKLNAGRHAWVIETGVSDIKWALKPSWNNSDTYPGGELRSNYSVGQDAHFAITPEPSSMALLSLGGLWLLQRKHN